ncbi:hypothetical protein POJ06DRAFT_47387 [Lipomyces tetrasporus]|uniref:Uncharacterized protein n=1 Tax=Lipomyces tetrasporus TaxID=54092 RepID=A0AAD7VPD1_9ASCO|nr:uncharacterized protein POJ06DRAFT_47387 [Lipomyces tetrasporus]KAJ8096581.1 hypothetical protein POJ06DRAFT_47387 [Lipomyces tetrasporus]
MTESLFQKADTKKPGYCSGARYRFQQPPTQSDKYALHAISLQRFLLVDTRLSNKDRLDLQAALQHVNIGSFVAGGAVSWNCAASTFNYSGIIVKLLGKSTAGFLGFFVGLNLGLVLGWDVVSYQFQNRKTCRAAMGLVREYPIISAWERYYGGDRDAMTKIVPSPLRKADGVPHGIECEVVNNTLNELRSKAESVASRFEVLATEYEARLQKSWTAFQDDSVKPQTSDKDAQGVSIDGRALASRFIDTYALYLSNDPRRPYFDGSFA